MPVRGFIQNYGRYPKWVLIAISGPPNSSEALVARDREPPAESGGEIAHNRRIQIDGRPRIGTPCRLFSDEIRKASR